MFWEYVYKIGRVAEPVLIQFLASLIVNMIGVGGLHITDAAFLTSATAVLLLPLFLWMYRADGMAREERAHRLRGADYAALAAGGLLANLILTRVVNLLVYSMPAELSNEVQEQLFGSAMLFQLLGLGLVVPVMEEVLFRGLVYNRLRGYTKTVWSAAALSAAVFAAVHGNLIQMLFAFPMGLLLAAVYHRYQTLRAPVVFHMAVNISSVLATAIM